METPLLITRLADKPEAVVNLTDEELDRVTLSVADHVDGAMNQPMIAAVLRELIFRRRGVTHAELGSRGKS